MSTLYALRLPFVVSFLALTVWLLYTVYRTNGRDKWL